jgi:hypothetical protein
MKGLRFPVLADLVGREPLFFFLIKKKKNKTIREGEITGTYKSLISNVSCWAEKASMYLHVQRTH